MKIYTKTGDDGSTALADGTRVSKGAARVWAYGEADELNSVLGLLRAEGLPTDTDEHLARAQMCLFTIGTCLADPGGRYPLDLDAVRPDWVESWIDAMERQLPPLRNFILPGGSRPAALAHLARATCRRVERRVAAMAADNGAAPVRAVVPFLNRLSDALFVLARFLNRLAGVEDVVWRGRN